MIAGDVILPGIKLDQGVLFYDSDELQFPGDLLHEAGQLAVKAPAGRKLAGAIAYPAMKTWLRQSCCKPPEIKLVRITGGHRDEKRTGQPLSCVACPAKISAAGIAGLMASPADGAPFTPRGTRG